MLETLTLEEKSSLFRLDRGNDDESLQFVSFYRASKVTGISICALRNACENQTQRSCDEKERYKSLKLTGQLYAIVVVPSPKRKFYANLVNE